MNKTNRKFNKHDILRKSLIVIFWLLVWEIVNLQVHNDILFVGPFSAIKCFFRNLVDPKWLLNVTTSFGTILLGFFIGMMLGIILGNAAYKFRMFDELFSPFVTVIKTIPVASFVVLVLIWVGPRLLSMYISLLIVFPNIYVNFKTGLSSVDKDMLDMAKIFSLNASKRFLYIYRPALAPFMKSGVSVSIGMSIKAGIAAEIIGLPENTLGERLYFSKVYLATDELFAWTLTIILLGYLVEKIILLLAGLYFDFYPYPKPLVGGSTDLPQDGGNGQNKGANLVFTRIKKSFDEKEVLPGNSFNFEYGKQYCLMGPSGCGKTTLLNVILGIVKPDDGYITGDMIKENGTIRNIRMSATFQENRLIEDANPIVNVMVAAGVSKNTAIQALSVILEEDLLYKKVSTFSGGQKRRVAIVRALLAQSDLLVLDEPFTGLDDNTKRDVVKFIDDNQRGRTIVMSSHDEKEAVMMGAKIIKL